MFVIRQQLFPRLVLGLEITVNPQHALKEAVDTSEAGHTRAA